METLVGFNMSKRTRKEFRRKYPNLTEELGGAGTVKIQAVRTSAKEAEKTSHNLHGYEPTAVDFIRRCENDAQALEIINFLEKNGKIEPSYARHLRAQLAERGLQSFGKRRKSGCYLCSE
ncbi:hypothetical protein ES706_00463 [subsurface metagenome]